MPGTRRLSLKNICINIYVLITGNPFSDLLENKLASSQGAPVLVCSRRAKVSQSDSLVNHSASFALAQHQTVYNSKIPVHRVGARN